jgi:hypothetical protein
MTRPTRRGRPTRRPGPEGIGVVHCLAPTPLTRGSGGQVVEPLLPISFSLRRTDRPANTAQRLAPARFCFRVKAGAVACAPRGVRFKKGRGLLTPGELEN